MTDCYDVATLQQFLNEELDPEQRKNIDNHLQKCSKCAATFEGLLDKHVAGMIRTPDPYTTVHEEPFSARGQPAVPSFPGYEILSKLGHGGMGQVYKARHLPLDRIVALKTIRADQDASGASLVELLIKRFRIEVEAAARLQHPNIAQIFEIGEQHGLPFFAMEFVEGGTLAHKLAGNPQPVEEAAGLVETLARAMHTAHEKGIIHRDLKPANVLLTKDGTPKISDFGLAKKLDAGAGQTQTGLPIGTPAYMAPEQVTGKPGDISPRTDVHALGIILYEALTGRPPFRGEFVAEILAQVEELEPVPLRRLRPKLPRDLETICLKSLQKEPKKRYASALALAEDLNRYRAGEPIHARPVGRLERLTKRCRRNPLATGLVALLVVAVIGVLAFGIWAGVERVRRADAQAVAANLSIEKAIADEKRKQSEELRKTLPWLQQAAVARNEQFHQKAALDLAIALTEHESLDTRVQQWEARQRALVPVATTSRRVLPAALANSANGGILVSTDYYTADIRVWRTDTWQQTSVLSGHIRPAEPDRPVNTVRGLAFHPDNPNELISVGLDGSLRSWDLVTGTALKKHPQQAVAANPQLMALAPETGDRPASGRHILTGDVKGTLTWWSLDRWGEIVKEKRAAHAGPIYVVRYDPRHCLWASAGEDSNVRLWDRDGRPLPDLVLGDKPSPIVLDLAFSPDGRQLAAAVQPNDRQLAAAVQFGRIHVWDVTNPERCLPIQEADDESAKRQDRAVTRLAFNSKGRLFYGGRDGTVREWDPSNRKQVPHQGWAHTDGIRGHRIVTALVARPGSEEIASGAVDGAIRIWNAGTGNPIAQLEGGSVNIVPWVPRKFGVCASAFCPKHDLLITATSSQSSQFLFRWDTRTLRERHTYGGLDQPENAVQRAFRVSALAIHPDGSRFVSAEPDGNLVWWDTMEGTITKREAHKPRNLQQFDWFRKFVEVYEKQDEANRGDFSWLTVTALAWSPDGKRVASAGVDGWLKLWDAATSKLEHSWKSDEPDPRPPVENETPANVIRIGWLAGTKEYPQRILLFDRSGDQLISAGNDNLIRVWDLKTYKVVPLELHASRVNAGTFSAGGKLFASGSVDGMVIIWDWQKRSPRQSICLKPLQVPKLSLDTRLDKQQKEATENSLRIQHQGVRSLAF
jgi:WD40 repeat protein